MLLTPPPRRSRGLQGGVKASLWGVCGHSATSSPASSGADQGPWSCFGTSFFPGVDEEDAFTSELVTAGGESLDSTGFPTEGPVASSSLPLVSPLPIGPKVGRCKVAEKQRGPVGPAGAFAPGTPNFAGAVIICFGLLLSPAGLRLVSTSPSLSSASGPVVSLEVSLLIVRLPCFSSSAVSSVGNCVQFET